MAVFKKVLFNLVLLMLNGNVHAHKHGEMEVVSGRETTDSLCYSFDWPEFSMYESYEWHA